MRIQVHRLPSLQGSDHKADLFEVLAAVPEGPGVQIFLNDHPNLVDREHILFEIQPLCGTLLRSLSGKIVKETLARDLVLANCEATILINDDIFISFMGLVRLPIANIISTC
ncbi:Hypothetical predicted protein [Drosophila guanche]|uniref:Uncharacterized protein n=1 Tax=Drosophila guanche TaxID=7266 RepID=A0A3B0J7G3_DROGU|nr:Hypothetical predicted protein [Drosophila guanche]